MAITSDRTRTAQRVEELTAYFREAVFRDDKAFVCASETECCASRGLEPLIRGQLHHVGTDYDLSMDGRPLRVAVIGQEYGGGHEFVTLERRSAEIAESRARRFKAGNGIEARNPHMRGTTSVLRLLFGRGLGTDYESEQLVLEGGRQVHIFDCFALTNFLLCSAVSQATKTRGKSTDTMRRNCTRHFRRAMEILEPTVLVLQSKWFRPDVIGAFDGPPDLLSDFVYRVEYGGRTAVLLSLTHPAAFGRSNWGMNARTPYLVGTVAKAVATARAALLE